ncbi:hypothetical protein FQN55_009446 [Onygenales sp. PD_40]|nr:hypothetical protein FQN55_009446 [Onygenales sp. PD_40]
MDKAARLKLLFGGDEELLQTNTRLQPVVKSQIKPTETNTKTQLEENNPPQTTQASVVPEPQAENNSGSEDGFDEYLAAFSQASRKAKRAQNRGKKSGHKVLDNSSLSAFSANIGGGAYLSSDNAKMFCPITSVSRFPYKYVRGEDSHLIAKEFFDGGKFWNRLWDMYAQSPHPPTPFYVSNRHGIAIHAFYPLPKPAAHMSQVFTYYIHPPPYISMQPLLLVPSLQVQSLIDEINERFGSELVIPSAGDLGFLIPFEDDGTPQPQFLGRSSSREDKDTMEATISAPPDGYHKPPKDCSVEVDRSFAAFQAKIAAAVEATRKKSKAAKKKRQGDRIQKLQDWCRAMKRSQCYLGMRPRRPRYLQPPETAGLEWEEQKRAEREYALACGTILLPFDVNRPAPSPFASQPIFISVDVEANEKSHHQITEIGVSTLDTLDLVGIPPGEGGCNWVAKIRSRHFRIKEYSHVVNKDYLEGCPDNFRFGESEWVSITKAAEVVDSCFHPPYSADIPLTIQHSETQQDTDIDVDTDADADVDGGVQLPPPEEAVPDQPTIPNEEASKPSYAIPDHKTRTRNIIFVAHDTQADLTYLRKLGCKTFCNPPATAKRNPTATPSILETLDTSILFRVLKRTTDPTSLAKILLDLSITGWHLHNGGNDARYTMEAIVGITLKSRLLLDHHPMTSDNDNKDDSKIPMTTNNWPLACGLRGFAGDEREEAARKAANAYDRSWKAEVERRVRAVVADTESRVREECASWDAAVEAEMGSGDVDGWAGEDVCAKE